MKCPRCDTSALEERQRVGITVDVCAQCRGIWLDRGELERHIARAVEEQDALERRSRRDHNDADDHYSGQMHHDKRHEYGDRRDANGRVRKRRWFASLADIFD